MIYFFLLISLIINPYILLLVNTSISKFKLPKIYSILVIIYFFIFTNLRTHGEFLYTSTGDDSDDYTLGIIRVMNDYSIIDILRGKADPFLDHIDVIFALYQLFLAKVFTPENIPILCSITFAILIVSTLFSYSLISKGIIELRSKLLISLIIINPYIIYLNQHLFRQAISLGVMLSISIPLFLRLFINEKYIKNKKLVSIFFLLSILLALGLHRGSTIPILILFSISTILSSGLLNQFYLLFKKFILGRRLILIIFLILSSLILFSITKKYLDAFLLYTFFDLKIRSNATGLRTALIGIIISLYSIYIIYKNSLKIYFKKSLKSLLLIFSISNLLISIFCILTPGGIVRLLFSTNVIILTMVTITHNFDKKLIKLFAFLMGILTYLFYVFLREGFWGKGNFFLPYLN